MEYSQDMKNRLRRIEGQVRGVLRMMDENRDCKEVITQLSALGSAMDRAIACIVGKNLEHCLRKEFEKGNMSNSELINEAVGLLIRSR